MTSKINSYAAYSNGNPFSSQAKMLFHANRLYEYIADGNTSSPIFMEVNLTDKCNLHCDWCISDNRDKSGNSIDIGSFEAFVEDYSTMGGKALTFSGGGEPTLYKQFRMAVGLSVSNNIELGLMTNGFFNCSLIKTISENFKWVRVSLDTVDRNVYIKTKGVDALENVLENIHSLKFGPAKIGINCNVGAHTTIKDVEEMVETLYDNCDYIQFRPVLPRWFSKELPKLNDSVWTHLVKYAGDEKINLSIDKFRDMESGKWFPFKSCEGHFFSPILDANGDVKVCMYHPGNDRFSFGNINNSTFSDIWNSLKRRDVINYVRSLDYQKKCQMCCKLCEINKLLDFMNNADKKLLDINFL
jgi:radical SAM protein with 4Fe4S-binding SPASM domain